MDLSGRRMKNDPGKVAASVRSRKTREEKSVPNAGGGMDKKGKTKVKVEVLCRGGYKGKETV